MCLWVTCFYHDVSFLHYYDNDLAVPEIFLGDNDSCSRMIDCISSANTVSFSRRRSARTFIASFLSFRTSKFVL